MICSYYEFGLERKSILYWIKHNPHSKWKLKLKALRGPHKLQTTAAKFSTSRNQRRRIFGVLFTSSQSAFRFRREINRVRLRRGAYKRDIIYPKECDCMIVSCLIPKKVKIEDFKRKWSSGSAISSVCVILIAFASLTRKWNFFLHISVWC